MTKAYYWCFEAIRGTEIERQRTKLAEYRSLLHEEAITTEAHPPSTTVSW
jgi:hypothetical protein